MPGFFMDTKIPAESFASFSGDDSHSSSDWGKDGFGTGKTYKRREKNRDAARKSRKKQTERADVLHEELQHLERSNAAFEREIADLKAELKRYTTALQQHEPMCSLFVGISSGGLAGPVPPLAKTAVSSITTSSIPALNVNSPPVVSAPSLSAQPGEAFSEISLSELLESTDWTPPWQPGHWSVI